MHRGGPVSARRNIGKRKNFKIQRWQAIRLGIRWNATAYVYLFIKKNQLGAISPGRSQEEYGLGQISKSRRLACGKEQAAVCWVQDGNFQWAELRVEGIVQPRTDVLKVKMRSPSQRENVQAGHMSCPGRGLFLHCRLAIFGGGGKKPALGVKFYRKSPLCTQSEDLR